ncbi:Cof-type HAD-IIB family hydrolase [Aggregatibacter aphrophilus]|uniref:Cof-type HAD-IIB family hydrolase n=1 Tax=Aggregatibacter aphrophilus TaxID=732 RepID=UPI0009F4861D|nr:Cof-type HAD-IIB family hydrolase [Aggregatibacter aphrophilus]PNL92749.1 Cof-type HAD-IIB family hydrolase [Aggregatibacter aphrophilus]
MQKLPYRAIVSDMDGTLLNGDHVVGDFTAQTLERLYDSKVDIVLATGRNYFDVSSILKKTKVKEAVLITSNGAQAHNLQGELLLNNSLPEEIAYQVMNLPLDDTRVCVNSYQADGWFINKDIPELYKYHKDSGFVYDVVDFKQHHGRDTEKVFFIARTPADLVELEHQLRDRFGAQTSITYSTPSCLEVMNKNVSKATALAQVVQARDYGLQDCIAFGDGMNDVEMLSEVGKGCIMGNADPRLIKNCPQLETIGRNTDEAVATYLRTIFGIY